MRRRWTQRGLSSYDIGIVSFWCRSLSFSSTCGGRTIFSLRRYASVQKHVDCHIFPAVRFFKSMEDSGATVAEVDHALHLHGNVTRTLTR